MRTVLAPLLSSVLLLAALAGCSSHPPPTGLTVALTKLERMADGTLTATLQFTNEAVVAFIVAGSRHQVFLNGQPAGMIDIKEPLGLPSEQVRTQSAKFVPTGAAPAAGDASYRLDSTLTLLLYGDSKEVHKTSSSGTVRVQ